MPVCLPAHPPGQIFFVERDMAAYVGFNYFYFCYVLIVFITVIISINYLGVCWGTELFGAFYYLFMRGDF